MILTKVSLRELTAEERHALEQLAHSRTAQARLVERAQILLAIADGRRPSRVAQQLGLSRPTVSTWIHRFNGRGLHGLEDRPRAGRPHTSTAEQRAEVIPIPSSARRNRARRNRSGAPNERTKRSTTAAAARAPSSAPSARRPVRH